MVQRSTRYSATTRATSSPTHTPFNQHYLAEGQPELLERLESGHYRVLVPEEAALLACAWLLRRGEADAAEALVRELAPLFAQLRFYPVPQPRPLRLAAGVSVEPAGEIRKRLSQRRPQPQVARMNEAIRVWAPLWQPHLDQGLPSPVHWSDQQTI